MEQNIEKFDRIVAQVLGELYQKFPIQTHVSIYELFECSPGKLVEGKWVESEDLKEQDQEFYFYTIRWLIDTGYLIGTIQNHHNSQITLSLKGLELLKSVPSSISGSESVGELLISALKSGAKDSAAILVNKALSSSNLVTQIGDLFGPAS